MRRGPSWGSLKENWDAASEMNENRMDLSISHSTSLLKVSLTRPVAGRLDVGTAAKLRRNFSTNSQDQIFPLATASRSRSLWNLSAAVSRAARNSAAGVTNRSPKGVFGRMSKSDLSLRM